MTVKPTEKLKPRTIFRKPKGIKVVTKKVLNKIADDIYNPKTGYYLNLCPGTLQNGPDPACEKRSMHCGLGELYFAVTGRQPEEDHVTETQVVEEIVSRSTIGDYDVILEKKLNKIREKINKFDLPKDIITIFQENIDDYQDDCKNNLEDGSSAEFRKIIDSIPNENDRGANITEDFKYRAKRVATVLRKAAALLPR